MTYRIRLTKLELADGQSVSPGHLTIFIGPNNAGKTTALKEIFATIRGHNPRAFVVRSVEYPPPPKPALSGRLEEYGLEECVERDGDNFEITAPRPYLLGSSRTILTPWQLSEWPEAFRKTIATHLIAYLRTEDRLRLLLTSNRTLPPENLLTASYGKADLGEFLTQSLADLNLPTRVIFDHLSSLDRINLRVAPPSANVPQNVSAHQARQLFEKLELLDEQGDGLRSSAGLLAAIKFGRRSLVLIDEPESFLHPPQAARLGQALARGGDAEPQLIVATHSVDFLRGALLSGRDLTIVRVTRGACHVLDPARLEELARDPVLTANRVLDGLFYPTCIVVEGDQDAVFYARALENLRIAEDILFVRANNKQTLHKVVGALREMGVRVAAIADFDILRRWSDIKNLVPANTHGELLVTQSRIATEIAKEGPPQRLAAMYSALGRLISEWPSGRDPQANLEAASRRIEDVLRHEDQWRPFKERGRGLLDAGLRAEFDRFSETCKSHGLFIVPTGELESWLVDCGVSTRKRKGWLDEALPALDADAASRRSGVWHFMEEIVAYVASGSGRPRATRTAATDSPVPAREDSDPPAPALSPTQVIALGNPESGSLNASRAGTNSAMRERRATRWGICQAVRGWLAAQFGRRLK